MNEEPKAMPKWLGKFPAYTQQLWLDSSKGGPETPVEPSPPAEGEFRFLLIPQNDTSNSDAVPMLVLIEEDLQDGYFQVMLTHCEDAMQTYSDLYVTSGETGLGYGVFISTAIQNQANVNCLSETAVGKLIPSMVRARGAYNFGPNDEWRRGRRFSSDQFVAQLDPRWKFVNEQLTAMQYLLGAYEDEGDTRDSELSAKHQAEDERRGKSDRDNGELLPSQKNN
jgi:hypothetical protein